MRLIPTTGGNGDDTTVNPADNPGDLPGDRIVDWNRDMGNVGIDDIGKGGIIQPFVRRFGRRRHVKEIDSCIDIFNGEGLSRSERAVQRRYPELTRYHKVPGARRPAERSKPIG